MQRKRQTIGCGLRVFLLLGFSVRAYGQDLGSGF